MIRTLAFATATLASTAAMAHPGHGAPAGAHTHLEEMIALAVAGSIAFVAFVAYRTWRAR